LIFNGFIGIVVSSVSGKSASFMYKEIVGSIPDWRETTHRQIAPF